ncbi:MAG TPA: hypothetical protein PKK23_21530 [Nitrospirales bacterium]|nr:hypothetical protein [Nitrospiraceae bacterium]HNP31643.1 hypothetical protein [Nitrospirales bacterium]
MRTPEVGQLLFPYPNKGKCPYWGVLKNCRQRRFRHLAVLTTPPYAPPAQSAAALLDEDF